MKTLILLRHAKSSWDDPDLEDHDRPLNKRGRGAAPVIAAWLAERGHVPDRIVCSSSLRTQETVERMRDALPDLPDPVIEPGLYHADPARMMELVRAQPDEANGVMLVGHQPGLSAFARMLAGGKVRPGCSRAFEHFPTAAAAVLTAQTEIWADIAPRTARFVEFAKPRELADRGAVAKSGA